MCGLGICTRCLEERKASYGLGSYTTDVSMMLCRAHYTEYVMRDLEKEPPIDVVFQGDFSELEKYMKDEGKILTVPKPCGLEQKLDVLTKKVDLMTAD